MADARDQVREGLSQLTYEPTQYEDSSYEIVGEFVPTTDFTPLEFEVMGSDERQADPMFDDFGRMPQSDLPRRWHLPEQAAQNEYKKQVDAETVPEGTLLTEQQIEQIRREALEEGTRAGYEAALEQSTARMQQMESRISGLRNDLDAQIRERLVGIEREAAQLALEVARKIITFAVDINPEYIYNIIHEAISLSGSAQIHQVRVSPDDMEFLRVVGMSKELREKQDGWSFVADPSVKTGCILESSAGEIDIRLDVAWERVKEEVLKVIK